MPLAGDTPKDCWIKETRTYKALSSQWKRVITLGDFNCHPGSDANESGGKLVSEVLLRKKQLGMGY